MESNSAVQLCLETGSFADLVKSVRRSVFGQSVSDNAQPPRLISVSHGRKCVAMPYQTPQRQPRFADFFPNLPVGKITTPEPHPQAARPRRQRHDEGRVGLVPPVRWTPPAKRRPREAQSTPNPDSPPTTPTPKPHGPAVHGTTTVGWDLSRPSAGRRRPKDDRGKPSRRPTQIHHQRPAPPSRTAPPSTARRG
jgi:hypothetical protein